MNISQKLTAGFGILVALTLIVISLSYWGSNQASVNINKTSQLRSPMVLVATQARANLLKMQASIRGYLALGDASYREDYENALQGFRKNLSELDTLILGWNNTQEDIPLGKLKTTFAEWSVLPDKLFELRDDPYKREPALRILIFDLQPIMVKTTRNIETIMKIQGKTTPTAENLLLLEDMSVYQASFLSMVSGLRGYVTTGRESFLFEYKSNLTQNNAAWDQIASHVDRLTPAQQLSLKEIEVSHSQFLTLVDQIFEIVSGENARQDLYLFKTEAVPKTEEMLALLDQLTATQQHALQQELDDGAADLAILRNRILVGGGIAIILGMVIAFALRQNLVKPIRKLTDVTKEVRGGNLDVIVPIQSTDEIGILAATFNSMTQQLRQTLQDLEQGRHDLATQKEYLEALHETALNLMNRLELTDLLDGILRRATQLLNTTHGYIYLINPLYKTTANATVPPESVLRLEVGLGLMSNYIGTKIKLGEGLCGKVWQTKQLMVVDNYQRWQGRSTNFKPSPIQAVVGIPLQIGDQFLGVLGVGYDVTSDYTFGQTEIKILNDFARIASITLDNARLYGELEIQNVSLEEQSQKLAKLNADKDKFFSILSHDLRTPFTALLGNMDLMLMDFEQFDKPKIKELLQQTFKSAQHAYNLLENLLTWSRMEQGHMKYRPQRVSLNTLAQNTVNLLHDVAGNKGIQLINAIPSQIFLHADKDMVAAVLRNLTSNALKFTQAGGQVTLGVEPYHDNAEENNDFDLITIFVADTGIGIPEEGAAKLFRMDTHYTTAGTAQEQGTGLGLIICQEMVEQNGGKIWLKSKLDEGTTVYFTIPLDDLTDLENILSAKEKISISPMLSPKEEGLLIAPPLENLTSLIQLASIGDMQGLQTEVVKIQKMDKNFVPFANQLQELAYNFRDEEIIRMLEQYLQPN